MKTFMILGECESLLRIEACVWDLRKRSSVRLSCFKLLLFSEKQCVFAFLGDSFCPKIKQMVFSFCLVKQSLDFFYGEVTEKSTGRGSNE